MEAIDPITIFYANDPKDLPELARQANEFIKEARRAGVMAHQIKVSEHTCAGEHTSGDQTSDRTYNYTLTIIIL